MITTTVLADRVRAMAARYRRVIVGITGAPGAGKSTLAEALVRDLGPAAVLVPMDGFHLSNRVLRSLGRQDRKGAPDTFDAAGYLSLLRRLRTADEEVVYAPLFRRDIEEPIAAGIQVRRKTPIIITEGNYLLLDTPAWKPVRELLDAVWYIEIDEALRLERLVARHVAFGKSLDAARAWAEGTDQRNAELIAASARNADLLLRL